MIPDIKDRLLKVIDDPHFGSRERILAKSSLHRIRELENQVETHWTTMANIALLAETRKKAISEQAATEIDSFLKRHSS